VIVIVIGFLLCAIADYCAGIYAQRWHRAS
jgi:hypothetical protein